MRAEDFGSTFSQSDSHKSKNVAQVWGWYP